MMKLTSLNLLSAGILRLASAKDGWTCEADGFWYENGVKSDLGNCDNDNKDGDGKSGNGCTPTSMGDYEVPQNIKKTCISHEDFSGDRCWWLYIPDEVKSATDGRKVPLVIDMHGGGGCAFHQWSYGVGFKVLADAEAAKAGGGMVVAWPQGGPGRLWASSGTSTRTDVASGKDLPTWSDIGFLEQLISNVVHANDVVDPERVYMSGFSLGCMMSHRFALERSNILAAFGCHGGDLSLYPTTQAEMDDDKAAYTLQPMPAYLTIGDADSWYSGAEASWNAWTYWNGCTNSTTHEDGDLVEHLSTSCASYTPDLKTAMLVIKGGPHAPDSRVAEKQWSFMSKYKRVGALDELPPKVAEMEDATVTGSSPPDTDITSTTITTTLAADTTAESTTEDDDLVSGGTTASCAHLLHASLGKFLVFNFLLALAGIHSSSS